MKIVVDTNVVISGVFFGGNLRRIVEAIVNGSINAYATADIVDEYMEIIDSMITRKQRNYTKRCGSYFRGAGTLQRPDMLYCCIEIRKGGTAYDQNLNMHRYRCLPKQADSLICYSALHIIGLLREPCKRDSHLRICADDIT